MATERKSDYQQPITELRDIRFDNVRIVAYQTSSRARDFTIIFPCHVFESLHIETTFSMSTQFEPAKHAHTKSSIRNSEDLGAVDVAVGQDEWWILGIH